MSEFNRRGALRLVLGAMQPVLDIEGQTRTLDEAVEAADLAMDEEPQFAEAFEAAVRAIYDAGYADGRGST